LNKRKSAARKGQITLLNASKHFKKGRPKNYLPEEDIRALAATFLKGEAVEGEVAVISTRQAEEADYNLSPSRWVGQAEEATSADIPELIDKLRELAAELRTSDQRLLQLLGSIAK
jgi:type I restriction enzyme M protein